MPPPTHGEVPWAFRLTAPPMDPVTPGRFCRTRGRCQRSIAPPGNPLFSFHPIGVIVRQRDESGECRFGTSHHTNNIFGAGTMADQGDDDRDIPAMQRILDNPFILLFIGILIPTMTYIVWGVMELISIPIAD